MTPTRKTAAAAGALYLVTHVTSICALVLYGPVLHGAEYVAGSGADTRVLLGALCEVVLALAVVGTAVALFPVVKAWNEGVALGYVALRTLEAGVIAVGVVSLLAVVTLRQDAAGTADAASLAATAEGLVAVHDWTFLVGPNFVCGADTVLVAHLMHRSRLVPRPIALLGLVGGSVIFASAIAELLGLYPQVGPIGALTAVPVFAWELSLAVHLVAKGFRPFPAAAGAGRPVLQRGPAGPARAGAGVAG